MNEGGWFQRLWPSLVALLGTVGVVALLLVVAGGEVETVDPGDAFDDASVEGVTPSPGGTGEATAPGSTPDPSSEPSPVPVRAPVVVLNQTTVEGLAGRTAEALEEDGWEVVEVGSFPSGVPETTVYFPPDLEEAATAMDDEWDGIDRVMPVFAGLSEGVLTVILADTDQPPVRGGE
ncbi:MAG TPA: LytR C-terminal domain-containing protein [Jiangellales bacterium]|nr:LytR C-terminal domain-containing protein [Jiangellales bacterium]